MLPPAKSLVRRHSMNFLVVRNLQIRKGKFQNLSNYLDKLEAMDRKELVASDPEVKYVHLPNVGLKNDGDDAWRGGYSIAYTHDTFGSVSECPPSSSLVLVAIHGTLGSHRDFRYMAGACSRIGHEENKNKDDITNFTTKFPVDLIRVDLPGYGSSKVLDSNRREIPIDTQHYSETLWKFLDVLYPANKKFVLLGHSLAGHIVLDMASSRPTSVSGIALIASIGLYPHKGVGGRVLYPLFRQLGRLLDHPYLGTLMKKAMHAGYIKFGGFSKKSSMGDVIHSHKRVAALDFKKTLETVKILNASEDHHVIHCFQAYATNDPHIEAAVQQDLSIALPAARILRFQRGGHNIQKTKSVEIASALKVWIEHIFESDIKDW